jgi:putative component of membrane protein insertase Oxa1/YidC/SpoIIIJ protein YidD
MTFPAELAIRSITLYQKYISPVKGYSCAYRVFHNDLSCSDYCKNEIKSLGILKGIKSTLKRFNECKLAALAIREKRKNMRERAKGSFSSIKSGCKRMNACEQLIFAELLGEIACCACIN